MTSLHLGVKWITVIETVQKVRPNRNLFAQTMKSTFVVGTRAHFFQSVETRATVLKVGSRHVHIGTSPLTLLVIASRKTFLLLL